MKYQFACQTRPYSARIIFALVLLLLSVLLPGAVAQNLEAIGSEDPIDISGGVNVSSVFYRANGMQDRRDPFNYFFSGNLNLSVYGWSVPLSFSYSNQESQFQQPFNQYGVSPTYKWITMHAGYRGMTFSNYTMNGHLFLGGGFDIVPGNRIKVSAFYGRLQKAVEEDTALAPASIPAYRRMGGGAKVVIGTEKSNVGLILFKARDEIGSLINAPLKNDVRPEENLVIGVNVTASPNERITIAGEYANSAITKDTYAELAPTRNMYDKLHFAFKPRTSSSYHNAVKGSATYSFVNAGIGLAYERVDPGYRTLGSYYFNNDIETFAFTGTSAFFKKLRMNAQAGVQRNNLDNRELNVMNRFSIALNANYQVSKRLSFNGSYSNFRTVVNFRSQFDVLNQESVYGDLDTLNFRQIAKNANMNMNFTLNENKDRRQNINVNMSLQQTSDAQADVDQPTGAKFYNLNVNYSLVVDRDISVSIAANANFTESQTVENKIYGPSMSAKKTFFDKKVSSNATVSYNRAFVNGLKANTVWNIRLSAAYTLKESHQFDVSLSRSSRWGIQNEMEQRFQELVIQFGYSYNFSSGKSK